MRLFFIKIRVGCFFNRTSYWIGIISLNKQKITKNSNFKSTLKRWQALCIYLDIIVISFNWEDNCFMVYIIFCYITISDSIKSHSKNKIKLIKFVKSIQNRQQKLASSLMVEEQKKSKHYEQMNLNTSCNGKLICLSHSIIAFTTSL